MTPMMPCVEETDTLPLIADVLSALDRAEIKWCHWKSNDVLERSACGDNDLDLLVHRGDGSRFLEVVHRLGLKQAAPSADKRLPGVLDFYGYDFRAGRFVHLHVHFQLIVGHDATKNYCLPLERTYLESVEIDRGFKVPRPEVDLIVLVVRLILKHATWDALLLGQGRLTKSERRELRYLSGRAELDDVRRILRSHAPFLDLELFEACLRAVEGRGSVFDRIRTGQVLKRALRPYARRGAWADVGTKVVRRAALGFRRKIRRRGRKKARLCNGGLMIAFVGGDGAGKSTAVAGVVDWLSGEFDVRRLHLGKPQRSLTTRFVQWGRTAARMALEAFGSGRSQTDETRSRDLTPTADGSLKSRARLSRMIWDVSVARDRHRAFARARRFSMNGGLVVCDRFPLPDLIRLMDAPQVEAAMPSHRRNRLIRWLAGLEGGWYRCMVPPEVLVVLRLDPEIAVSRKKGEGAAYVRMRSREVWEADFRETPAVVVDASIPQDELLAQLKELIWARI